MIKCISTHHFSIYIPNMGTIISFLLFIKGLYQLCIKYQMFVIHIVICIRTMLFIFTLIVFGVYFYTCYVLLLIICCWIYGIGKICLS